MITRGWNCDKLNSVVCA